MPGYSKPKVSDIASWSTLFESDMVTVEAADGEWSNFFFRVTPSETRPKYFFGESAHADAARYASDFDFQAWGCT